MYVYIYIYIYIYIYVYTHTDDMTRSAISRSPLLRVGGAGGLARAWAAREPEARAAGDYFCLFTLLFVFVASFVIVRYLFF